MKTYFVTGGEGFIGHHLCKELLKDKENQVITYDAQKHFISLDKSNWPFYQDYRLKTLRDERLTRIRGDVADGGLLRESLETHKPNIVIHLASLPVASISNRYPEEAKRNIYDGTVVLLDALRASNFELDRIVYTSSSMVYGDFKRDGTGKVIPAREDQTCEPLGLYCAMKLGGEYLVKAYSKRFGFNYTIIRPSAAYGPTDCNRRVTEIFVNNALTGKELLLDNGGLHQLDFSYVKDVAKGFVLAANSDKAINQTFNITRGEGRSIKELAEIIRELIPDTKFIEKEVKVYRPNRGTLDITKAKTLLNYNPEYSLETGLEEYIKFINAVANTEQLI